MQHWDGRDVQGIAGEGLVRADPPFAEDDLFIAAGHNIFCAHQQLLQRPGDAALEEDRLICLAQGPQQLEVLRVSGADLDDIHVVEQVQMIDAHDLRDDGQARLPFGFGEELQAVRLQALEVIRRGAGLERAAPKHIGPGCLDPLGDADNLLLRLHGARPSDHAEIAAADLDAAQVEDVYKRQP